MAEDKRVLITGASGFIGSRLVRALSQSGVRPCVLINSTAAGLPWRIREFWQSVCIHRANLQDLAALEHELHSHEVVSVYHLAGFTHPGHSWSRAQECYRVNVEGTLNLVHALSRTGSRAHLVYASTSEVYGSAQGQQSAVITPTRPLSPYASSKLAGEDVCRIYALRGDVACTLVRIHNVYGPAQSPDRIVPEAVMAALKGVELPMTSGAQTRDFVYIDDVVDALLAIGRTKPASGTPIVDIASGVAVSIRTIVETIYREVGNGGGPLVGALPTRDNELWSMCGDPAPLCALLGRSPSSLEVGLQGTVQWYRNYVEYYL